MEEKITAWLARDERGDLYLYNEEPHKDNKYPEWLIGFDNEGKYIEIDTELFPQVKWEDKEPTEVELTIKICE